MSDVHPLSRHRNAPGVSFSWSRAIGLSALKGKISRKIGVPLTRSGREKKLGHLVMHSAGAIIGLVLVSAGVIATTHPEFMQKLAAAFQTLG